MDLAHTQNKSAYSTSFIYYYSIEPLLHLLWVQMVWERWVNMNVKNLIL